MLTPDEQSRYRRQLTIADWGEEAQLRLKKASVFVAGAGGLGSPVLMYLAAAGVGTISVCDYDSVELSNLNRQILHCDARIGSPKADSARDTLHTTNPNVTVLPVKTQITRKNAASLIGSSDLIIDCLDNFEARHILNTVSVSRSIPMIHAGISGFQGQITFLKPPETPCLACFYQKPKKTTPPVLGATAGAIGSLQAMEALKYLTGIGGNLMGKLLFFDGKEMRMETVKIVRNPRCRVCGKIRQNV
jgi:molybdopterin-synthase adenylyltransferase